MKQSLFTRSFILLLLGQMFFPHRQLHLEIRAVHVRVGTDGIG